MKRLTDFNNKEILHYIMQSERLRDMLGNYIHESEMDWIGEKMSVFKKRRGCADLSIGTYQHSYLSVLKPYEFLMACEDSYKCFGASGREMRKIEQCKKLVGTNLFNHCVNQLCEIHFEDEFQEIIKHIEDCMYDIYIKDETDRLLDYIDCFADCNIDDIFVKDNGELVRLDYVC